MKKFVLYSLWSIISLGMVVSISEYSVNAATITGVNPGANGLYNIKPIMPKNNLNSPSRYVPFDINQNQIKAINHNLESQSTPSVKGFEQQVKESKDKSTRAVKNKIDSSVINVSDDYKIEK